MKSTTSALGTRMKAYRKNHNLTQEKAAEFFGISLVYYGEIERGNRFPGMDTLNGFCEKMQCSLSDLVGEYVPSTVDQKKLALIREIESLLFDASFESLQASYELLKALNKNSDEN